VEYNRSLIKVDWLDASITIRVVDAVVIVFSLAVTIKHFHNPLANGKQGLIPEEIYQPLLTNKKQGNLD
jgi:hypothetical protein